MLRKVPGDEARVRVKAGPGGSNFAENAAGTSLQKIKKFVQYATLEHSVPLIFSHRALQEIQLLTYCLHRDTVATARTQSVAIDLFLPLLRPQCFCQNVADAVLQAMKFAK